MKPQWKPFSAVVALGTAFALFPTLLNGAGFALQEHSISGLGTGFASGAAAGDDNSSMFFNPATLSLYDSAQITTGVHFILPEAKFKNSGTLTGFVPGVSPGVPTEGPNATSDEIAIVPNFFASMPLNEDWAIGIGISTPYGLATKYDDGWVGRYIALETDLLTINTNIAVSYRLSDTVSVGFGVSVLYGDAVLSNAIDFGLIYLNGLQNGTIPVNDVTLALAEQVQAALGSTTFDGKVELDGDDIGYGFNIGVLFTPNEDLRIGLHYRSKVDLTLEGRANFTVGPLVDFFAPSFADQGGMVDLSLPDTAQASIHYQASPKWAVMADVFHTWWSKFDELVIQYEAGILPDTVIPEKWDDTWRFSVGTTYRISEALELRAGLVLDESGVTSDIYRSPRIPDEDRTWLSVGLGYDVSEHFRVDFAYTHIWVDDPKINNPTHTPGQVLVGDMEAVVDLISIGGTYRF